MVLFWILGALFVALFVIIPLVERFGPNLGKEEAAKYWRFIMPLMAIILVLQGLRMLF